MLKHTILSAILLSSLFGSKEFTEKDFITLSGALSPEVRMAVKQEKKGWHIRVETENPYAAVNARLAIATDRSEVVTLNKFPADYLFRFSENTEESPLRIALEISWMNADGSLRQRELFRTPSIGGILPDDPRFWEQFDYASYRKQVEDKSLRISIPVKQPMAGKLSVVIEDRQGKRIRNLVSGQETATGKHTIEWDGRDETGSLAAPGTYTYRTASHPGIIPEYIMQFANGDETFFTPFGSNHGTMTAMAANSRYVFAAAPLTEGGWAIIAMTPDGHFVRGYQHLNGPGIEEVFLATNERYLYVVNDGRSWGGRNKPPVMTLSVYDIETGGIVGFKGSSRQFALLRERAVRDIEEASSHHFALSGAAVIENRLYVSDREENCIHIVDPAYGKIIGDIPLPQAGVLTADGRNLIAFSGKRLVSVDPVSRTATTLFDISFEPRGISLRDEQICVTGDADSTIKIFNRNGNTVRAIGEPGGPYQGPWQPDRLVNPVGLTFDVNGRLWIAEDRRNPKRLSRWNFESGHCEYSKIGCPSYGSPGAGFDPDEPQRWFGQRCMWKVNQETGKAEIVSVLQKNEGHIQGRIPQCVNYRFFKQDGRTFVLGMHKATIISELMPDGSLRDLALISDVHSLLYALNWKRVPAYCDTIEKLFPKAEFEKKYGDQSCRYCGVLWIDGDGDEDFDSNEFQFLPENSKLSSFGWGFSATSLNLTLPYRNEKGERFVLKLSPESFNSVGAPEYSFKKALSKAVPVKDDLPQGSRSMLDTTLDDTHGDMVVNTDPYMFGISGDGAIKWLFQNRWSNVHGSHKAPLPRPGEIQGVLFGLGTAPLDKEGDVIIFAGNHGRFFLMTTDGIYLDEMFQDCRVAEVVGPGLIGGEAFGGFFGYDRINKRYILQAGNSGYRIYNIRGLDQVIRDSGSIKVTSEMLAAADRRTTASEIADNKSKQAVFQKLSKEGMPDFNTLPVSAEWTRGSWNIRLRGAYDSKRLYIQYDVPDSSPWINNGNDWTQLFKTGDSVDIKIGTDPQSPHDRQNPVPGDLRLLLAPFKGKPLAVLYRHRLIDKTGANPIEFTCPWRSEIVDDVRKLDDAEIRVQCFDDTYRIEAGIPLAELNLQQIAGGITLQADFGVIYGDSKGTINLSRIYWSNQATGLVNDVPGEIMLIPALWGTVNFKENMF